jgi:hypothetical protein
MSPLKKQDRQQTEESKNSIEKRQNTKKEGEYLIATLINTIKQERELQRHGIHKRAYNKFYT